MGDTSVIADPQPRPETCGAAFQPASPSPLKPYHLFEKFGEYFVYHLASNRFFRIDKPTSELLERCLTEPLETAKTRFIAESNYAKDEIEGISQEICLLADQGLFDLPNWELSEEEVERQLDARYNAPWTKLELALAETCNLACTYCYCGTCRDMPNQGLMSERVARQAITWLFAVSGREREVGLTFFGGEPLLNKPVLRFCMEYSQRLAKLHGKSVRYTMTTNGTLLDDESINYIKRHNFGLMVSMDGPQGVHDAQCPLKDGSGSFVLAQSGIKALMKRRRRVTVRCTRTRHAPHARDLIGFFEDFGFTRIVLGRVVNPVRPSPVDCRPDDFERFEREDEELLPWMFEQLGKGDIPKYFPYGSFIYDRGRANGGPHKRSLFRCGACRGTATVGADGKLYPCHRFVGMANFIIGDIADGPDIEKAKQFWRDYHAIVQGDCATCWVRPECNGPCPWELACADGTFARPDQSRCGLVRGFYARASWVYYKVQSDYPDTYARFIRTRDDGQDARRSRAERPRRERKDSGNGRNRAQCNCVEGEPAR